MVKDEELVLDLDVFMKASIGLLERYIDIANNIACECPPNGGRGITRPPDELDSESVNKQCARLERWNQLEEIMSAAHAIGSAYSRAREMTMRYGDVVRKTGAIGDNKLIFDRIDKIAKIYAQIATGAPVFKILPGGRVVRS